MAESSKISIKSLISLFEKKIENRFPEGTSKELTIHHISQEQKKNLANILRRKESSSSYNRFDRPQSSLALLTPNGSLATTTPMHKSQSSVDSGGTTVTLTGVKSWPRKYLEEPNPEKELAGISSGNQYEIDDDSSKISVLTIPSDVTAEQRNSEQDGLRPDSVKQERLDENVTMIQGHHLNREKLRLARAASARDKLMRIEAENRLKQANMRILGLSKQLEDKKKELLRYRTDHKDHAKTQEDLRKQTQLNLDLSRKLSHANDKILTLIQRLEAIASNVNVENKKSASKLTPLKPKDDSKSTMDQENDENKFKLRENQTKSKRKQLTLDDVKEEEEFKTPSLEKKKDEAKIKKSASHSDRSLEHSVPVFSHSFSMSELTKSCRPLPNLHFGLDRPKRKKNYNSPCTAGSRAHKVDAEKSQPQVISAM